MVLIIPAAVQAQSFQWAGNFGSTSTDSGEDVAIDANGNTITVGLFQGTIDLDPGAGVSNHTSGGSWDGFVSKLDENGNFLWGFTMGNTGGDGIYAVDVDASGNVYITGIFTGTVDVDPSAGVFNLVSYSTFSVDAFWAKYDANGNLLNAYSWGGSGYDQGSDIEVTPSGEVYIIGDFENTVDFAPGAANISRTSNGGHDIFIVRYNTSYLLNYIVTVGTNSTSIFTDRGTGIDVDASGNIFVTGFFRGTMNMNPNGTAYNLSSSSSFADGFVAKYDTNENLVWAKDIGGSSEDKILDCTVDNAGSVYVTGKFTGSVDFNPGGTANALTSVPVSNSDAFVGKYSSSGTFEWVFRLGGLYALDEGKAISCNDNAVFVGGEFRGTNVNFNPSGSNPLSSTGGVNGFVGVYSFSGDHLWSGVFNPVNSSRVMGMDVLSSNELVATGQFFGTTDFDAESGVSQLTPNGASDAFTTKYMLCESMATAATINVTAPCMYTVPSGDETYFVSGTYMDTIPNNVGCDSILTIILTVNPSESYLTASACNSYTSPSGAHTWTVSGSYTDTLFGASYLGCDSILNISLSILNTGSTINPVSCDSYLSPGGSTYTASGTYIDVIPNAAGCDSTITINLTITESSVSTITVTECDSYLSPAGSTYSSSGTYTDVIPNAVGCDSTITINLTITESSTSTITVTECDSYLSPAGSTYNTSGTYTDVIPNAAGCDSTITINLTITESSNSTITVTECDSYLSPAGSTYSSSGTYTDVIPNAAGCDSTITIDLTIIESSTSTITVTECDSYLSPAGSTYSSSGTYTDVIPNAAGCDSTITIDLTIIESSTSTITVTECDSYLSPGGSTYNTSGTYTEVIPNAAGCDSTITIDLTITESSTATITVTECDSYLSPGGSTYSTSGTYTDVIPNAVGCDSTITIDLTITESSSSTITVTECDSYLSPGGSTYSTSGAYTDVIPNAVGCDSTITINLTIIESSTSTITVTECDSYLSPGGSTYNTSGTYTEVIPNAVGCDSTITIDLTITQSSSSTITVTQCNSYLSPGGSTYNTSGTYTEVIPNAVGCDSTITINLTINTVDTGITQSSAMLTSSAVGAQYQWLDCDQGFSIILAETNQQFTALTNGNYAVEVTENGCIDTSSCRSVIDVGIQETGYFENVNIYPNPSHGTIIISMGNWKAAVEVSILNSFGQIVYQSSLFKPETQIQFEGKAGIYYVLLTNDSGKQIAYKIHKI